MARPRLVARLVLVGAAVGAGWSAGACTRCDIDCSAPARTESVVAEVRSTGADVVLVRTEAGETIEVRLFGGSPADLEEGTSYRFPLLYPEADPAAVDPDLATTTVPGSPPEVAPVPDEPAAAAAADGPAAFFPADCDCVPGYITDLDGEVVDPGVDIPFRRLAIAFIAASFLATLGWAIARWYREVPL